MKKRLYALAVIAISATIALSAYAQQVDSQREAARNACRDDAKKFCGDVQPGGGRIVKCLQDHSSDISSACHDIMQKFQNRQKNKVEREDDRDSGAGQ